MEHRFTPTVYYNTMGPHEPVLRIRDGDSIVTTTLDCWGGDAEEHQAHSAPNPQTGPFYIEGAEPGDSLAVTIDHLAPNRRYGFQSTVLQPNVVDPGAVREMPERMQARWDLQAEPGMAVLVEPVDMALAGWRVPVRSMLGCIGTAPCESQAISTSSSAEHGGNMDYNGIVAGAVIYLPVFEPGGLLFVGDGHAVQGAGELLGQGIEISMDVRLTVRLRKGRSIGRPRGEDERYIFTLGNARPLDQALQHATTEMLRWLQEEEFGLDPRAAHTVLGQLVEYEVGNTIDPAYTMVCKLQKEQLRAAGLKC